jgi:hypothetical protein
LGIEARSVFTTLGPSWMTVKSNRRQRRQKQHGFRLSLRCNFRRIKRCTGAEVAHW